MRGRPVGGAVGVGNRRRPGLRGSGVFRIGGWSSLGCRRQSSGLVSGLIDGSVERTRVAPVQRACRRSRGRLRSGRRAPGSRRPDHEVGERLRR